MYSLKDNIKPIQFISINSFGKIVLHAESATFLRSLPAPISLAAILGPSQTGKSFLLQQIISQGTWNQSGTTGLWLWNKPMLAYNQEQRITSIVLVDSQGFGLERKRNDQTLLALLLMLANCLLYNSIGPIDEISFSQMEEVMSVARQLTEHSCEFHWLLRDFDPALVDALGGSISGQQYMENQLMAAQTGFEGTVQTLRKAFPNRTCSCFVKPTPHSSEQPPQFLKQIIEVRKRLNGIPSMSLDGGALVAVIQAYIDSLNAGDSVGRACEEGRDCRMRMECLARLGEELRGLEQRQSCNQIEDLQEQLGELRLQLKEYYQQRMCSHRQIQSLDEELNEILQDFQELNCSRTPTPSREVIRLHVSKPDSLNIPKADKMVRLSLNISDSDKPDNSHSQAHLQSHMRLPLTSLGRIHTDKNLIHSKLQEYETKLFRYQLEVTCSRKEMEGLRDDYDRSRQEAESRAEIIEQMQEKMMLREREYESEVQKLREELQEAKKGKLMVQSELAKVQILHSEKVAYLQQQLQEATENAQQELQLRQQKYRARLADSLKQTEQLKKSHSEQLAHLKCLYQQSHEQLADSKHQQNTDTFYKEMREQMGQINNLRELLDRERYASAQQADSLAVLRKQLEAKEEAHKEAMQQVGKRAKEAERHQQEVYAAKLQAKDRIIQELQQRIAQVGQATQDSLNQLISENNRLLAELQQKERRLTSFSTASQQTFREIAQLKDDLQEHEETIQNLTSKMKQLEEERNEQRQRNTELLQARQDLRSLLQQKEEKLENTQNEADELKGEVAVLQETHEIQVAHLKEKYQIQMAELKQLFDTERTRLQNKLKELQNAAEMTRRLREDYEDLQQESVQAEFQLREALDQRERELNTTKACLKELTQECQRFTKKNAELMASVVQAREQNIIACEEGAESERKVREQLQASLAQASELASQREKVIAVLRAQQERESKANASKIELFQKEIEQLHRKLKALEEESTRQVTKGKEAFLESQKAESELKQQVALLTHRLSLQQQSLTFRAQSKGAEVGKLNEKIKLLQGKHNETAILTSSLQQQLKQKEEQCERLQRLLKAFCNEKEVALSNIEELQNRGRLNQRKYEAHLNLFQQKLQQKKIEAEELRQRVEQYRQDYDCLTQIKVALERNLERQVMLRQEREARVQVAQVVQVQRKKA